MPSGFHLEPVRRETDVYIKAVSKYFDGLEPDFPSPDKDPRLSPSARGEVPEGSDPGILLGPRYPVDVAALSPAIPSSMPVAAPGVVATAQSLVSSWWVWAAIVFVVVLWPSHSRK